MTPAAQTYKLLEGFHKNGFSTSLYRKKKLLSQFNTPDEINMTFSNRKIYTETDLYLQTNDNAC